MLSRNIAQPRSALRTFVQGQGQALHCLRQHRQGLQPGCQRALFASDVVFFESIDYNPTLAWFCAGEIKAVCAQDAASDPQGLHVIRCLRRQALRSEVTFTHGCRAVRSALVLSRSHPNTP